MTKEEGNRRMILQHPRVRWTPGVTVRITLKKLSTICSSELQGREEGKDHEVSYNEGLSFWA